MVLVSSFAVYRTATLASGGRHDESVPIEDVLEAAAADHLHGEEEPLLAVHAEPHALPHTAEALCVELRHMADWLSLTRMEIADRGDLAPALLALNVGVP